MFLIIDLRDQENKSHDSVKLNFQAQTTIEQLQDEICSSFRIALHYQEIFDSNDRRIDLLIGSLENAGIRNNETLILKHADLPWWIEYKECVELVLKQCTNKVAIAIIAVRHHEQLTKSGFFDVYAKFENFRRQKHFKVASWADSDVNLIRKATEQYFRNLHDQRRGNEDSEFICYFEERDADLKGRSTNTLAFVRLHGEDLVSKYNVKCHHYGPKGTSSGQVPDISEFYCYKLLELIGVGPKSHIIPPSTSTGIKTSTYIATQWDDKFELLENVIDENSLCADVVVQLVMLKVLLFISDLHEQNCGRWKGTKHAAIVDFAPTDNFMVYPDIKSEMITAFPDKRWKKEYSAVKNQHDDKSWLKIAKMYLDKWDLSSKIEWAREQLDPTKVLLKSLEIGFKKRQLRFSLTDQLNEYIDTLYKNLENFQTLLNSIV